MDAEADKQKLIDDWIEACEVEEDAHATAVCLAQQLRDDYDTDVNDLDV